MDMGCNRQRVAQVFGQDRVAINSKWGRIHEGQAWACWTGEGLEDQEFGFETLSLKGLLKIM